MYSKRLEFYRDVFGGWRWECFDAKGEAQDSPFSYDTRAECVADARRRGLIVQRRGAAPASDTRGPRRRVSDTQGTRLPATAGASVAAA